MFSLEINLDEERFKSFCEGREVLVPPNETTPIHVTGVPGGMSDGSPSVMLGIDIGGRSVVMVETSLKLFLDAADVLRERLGDPRRKR